MIILNQLNDIYHVLNINNNRTMLPKSFESHFPTQQITGAKTDHQNG